ncbi:general secretion pathway protein GspK [Pseudorhodoferax aquiterrae]|uniref:Type II secretion system protein K n=1 Tax=Pseudorhodoferax aquiterrae TaxID=747304 RepID=A0ABQ3FXL2_9BURK|nr:type II secretion system minor pseudopilin GspK [Pseudorhodoferax aquiterrae]GHC75147.1 general secretion pathway protein GspK [Pseudorhodoferax aquiterrae]
MKRAQAQRGAALLLAMLTVTLVATFAATALWQQWRAVEVEQSERARSQSTWVLVGALDWARLILREDGRASGSIDHLAEPWAVPLQESRMSTFLAAENGVSQGGDEGLPEVFLSGSIVDLQSRMNVANLVDADGKLIEKPLEAFKRLFELLGLPHAELMAMAENLRRASQKQTDDGADVPLRPERFEQLVWLGVSQATLRVLEPHVTLLPQNDTKINLNTASAQVIAASSEDLDLADAQRLVQARTNSPLRDLPSAAKILNPDGPLATTNYSVTSSFFEVNGRLRMEGTVVSERSLVQRKNNAVTTVWRQRVAGERQP